MLLLVFTVVKVNGLRGLSFQLHKVVVYPVDQAVCCYVYPKNQVGSGRVGYPNPPEDCLK